MLKNIHIYYILIRVYYILIKFEYFLPSNIIKEFQGISNNKKFI